MNRKRDRDRLNTRGTKVYFLEGYSILRGEVTRVVKDSASKVKVRSQGKSYEKDICDLAEYKTSSIYRRFEKIVNSYKSALKSNIAYHKAKIKQLKSRESQHNKLIRYFKSELRK